MDKDANELNIDFNSFLKPDYPELGIFASPYFYNVIAPIYATKLENKSETFSLVFGDFDKLNFINTKYGFQKGNKIMHSILQIIRNTFPEWAVISRIGGDEFVIIIDSQNKQDSDEYISKINDITKEKSEQLKGASITLCSGDSTQYDSFNELYSNTHNEVSLEKLKLDSEHSDPWKVLEYKIANDMHSIINTFRFSNRYAFSHKHTQYLGNALLTTAIPILQNPSLLKSYQNNNPEIPTFNTFGLNKDELESIYQADDIMFSNCSDSKIKNVTNSLIVNPHTNLFGKPYFNNYMLPSLIQNALPSNVIYFSVSGLKISNTINGYESTDEQLKNISTAMQKSLNDLLYTPLCTTPFEHNPSSNYLFDMRGGNFLAIIGDNSKIDINDINDIMKNCNQAADSLGVVASSKNDVLPNDLLECIDLLNKDCEYKKIHLKDKALTSDTLDSIIKHCISDCISFYVNNIPDYESDTQKRKFLDKLFHASLDTMIQNNENVVQNKDETQK